MKVILASESPYRAQQLKDFGLQFTTQSPKVDENQLKVKFKKASPKRLSLLLARAKAVSIQSENPTDLIIGCDQLVNFKGRVMGKPGTRDRAISMLKELSGKTHHLITSICVVHENRIFADTVVARIALRKLNREEIVQYVYRDQPLDCAGSYKFELSGWGLVRTISVSDPSSLIGMPLISLTQAFREMDLPLPFGQKRGDK